MEYLTNVRYHKNMIPTCYQVSAMQRYSESLAKSTAYAPDANLAAADMTSNFHDFEAAMLNVVMNNQPGMMYWNGGDGGGNSKNDYRANIMGAGNPITAIFKAFNTANEKNVNPYLNLFDIIIPNGYGNGYYNNYSRIVTLGDHRYKVWLHGYSSNVSKSYYNIYKAGFDYLDQFTKYAESSKHNGGYAYGFYLTGYNRNYLITIGANTAQGYNYLVSEYFKYEKN